MDNLVEYSTGKWTDKECQQFEEGCVECGWGQWKAMTAVIPSRNTNQIKSHAQKFLLHRPERKAELDCKHETWKSKRQWLGVSAAEILSLKKSCRKAGSSKKKLASRPPLKPLKVKPVKKSSDAKSSSKNTGKSKVKSIPKKATKLTRTIAPVFTPAKRSSRIGGKVAAGPTKKTTGAVVNDMKEKRVLRDQPFQDSEIEDDDPFVTSILEDIDSLLEPDFGIFKFFDTSSSVDGHDEISAAASAREETNTAPFTCPRDSIFTQRLTESNEIEAILASAGTNSPAPCVSPGRSVGKDFARLSAALGPNKHFDLSSTAPRRISDSSAATDVIDAMEYKFLNGFVVDDDDDEEEEENNCETVKALCDADLLHSFPDTENSGTEEEAMDVSSPGELFLPNNENNKNFATSYHMSNVCETANADVSIYNEIIGRLFACPDFDSENKFIECSTGTKRTALDNFTLLRIRIAEEIDLNHRNIQWWKDNVTNENCQKKSLEHLIALIQVMLNVQEWRVIDADGAGSLQTTFNVEDDILSIGQELKGVWERVERSLARNQFRLFGEGGFERHLATAAMVNALQQSCRETVISFAV